MVVFPTIQKYEPNCLNELSLRLRDPIWLHGNSELLNLKLIKLVIMVMHERGLITVSFKNFTELTLNTSLIVKCYLNIC